MFKTISTDGIDGGAEGAERNASARWAVTSLALSMLLSSLGTSVANVAVPALAVAFGAAFHEVQWIVVVYLLVITALIVGAGRLGDVIGRRRLMVGGVALFTLASALCGVAPTLGLLIAARAAQGVGGAVMMALTLTFVAETVPKAETGRAMGFLGAMSAVGTALGPSLGGALVAGFGWRAIFLVNVPFGVLTAVLVHRHLPGDHHGRPGERGVVDLLGTLLLALTLAAYALAMALGRGRVGPVNVALLMAAACGLGLFVLAETRSASPLIRVAMLRDRPLRSSLATNGLVATVMMTTLVVGPVYVSRALALDTALLGVVLSVGPLVAALVGLLAGGLVDRHGAPAMTLVGLLGAAVGALSLSMLPTTTVVGYVVPISVLTAGYAVFQAANNAAVMMNARPDQRGVVSGMLTLSRNLGLSTGAAVMGAVFAAQSGATDITAATPEVVAAGMRGTFAVAAGLIVVAIAIAIGGRAAAAPAGPVEGRPGDTGVARSDGLSAAAS